MEYQSHSLLVESYETVTHDTRSWYHHKYIWHGGFLKYFQSVSLLYISTLYPKALYLVLLINLRVVSTMSPIMVKVSDA